MDADDGFEEILPPALMKLQRPCVMRCSAMGRQRAKRVSITFRLDFLDPDVARIIEHGPRFSIAFNPAMKVVRIKVDERGRYETITAPRGPRVRILRFPFPSAGMVFCSDDVGVQPDANVAQGAVLIDLPKQFLPPPVVARLPERERAVVAAQLPGRLIPAPVSVSSQIMGDPAPQRSALAQREARLKEEAPERTLTNEEVIRNGLRGLRFAPAEATIMDLLLRRESVTAAAIMVATRAPADIDNDDRDPKLAEVYISKLRAKLDRLDITIDKIKGVGWRFSPATKAIMRAEIDSARGAMQAAA
jgi:hypothetical protein